MKALLMSTRDAASVNIRDRLLEEAQWEVVGSFDGRPVRWHNGLLLLEKEGLHLEFEEVDEDIRTFLSCAPSRPWDAPHNAGGRLEAVVFLSKHRSERKMDSLTVHPPGNYHEALYGGRQGALPDSAPHEMTAALRSLYRVKKEAGLKDLASFEVTHHGPYLGTPSFFMEIGSDETRWGVVELGRVLARALLSDDFANKGGDLPIAIGVGGGHYAPRFSDRAIGGQLAFGHMVPDHALREEGDVERTMGLALKATKGASVVCIHRTRNNERFQGRIESVAKDLGLKVIG